MTDREELLRRLDAEIRLKELELKIFHLEQANTMRVRFSVVFAQRFYLLTHWRECRDCRKSVGIYESCLESRIKTGKCVFEIGFEALEKLPWPANKESKE